MVKGLRGFILLEAACKRKMENCRKKIKQLNRGESPSSEDSSLEDLDEVKVVEKNDGVKQEVPEEFFCPECGEAGMCVFGGKCEKCGGKAAVVKQEVVVEEAGAAGKGKGKGKEAAENVVEEAGAAGKGEGKGKGAAKNVVPIKMKNDNFYKSLKGEGGTKSYICRRCWEGSGSTSHTWDGFCTEPRRYA